MMDIMYNIVPDLEFFKFLTPYYYGNAAAIYSGEESRIGFALLGLAVTVIVVVLGGMVYKKRDMAAQRWINIGKLSHTNLKYKNFKESV